VQFFAPFLASRPCGGGDNVMLAHEYGAKFIAQVGSVADAKLAIQHGVDVIICQGYEAGGHGLRRELGNSAMSLASQTKRMTDVPVLASGGIARAAIPTQAADMGMAVNLGVRPEDLVETTGEPLFSGMVEITEALGEVTLLYFQRQGGAAQVVAKLPGIHADLRRKEVKLAADPRKIHLFAKGRSLLYR
jgi:hypothetical protein